MPRARSFTFSSYAVDTTRSIASFVYKVELENGKTRTYTDRLFIPGVTPEQWAQIPREVLEPTLQALLLMLGINYWTVYPTPNKHIEGFTLTSEQAEFWNTLYLHGLAEFFFLMKMDYRGLISFPFSESATAPTPTPFPRPTRALLLNGAGKDSILSAELLKEAGMPFDFFSFAPTLAHERIAKLVGAKTVRVTRRRDPRINFLALRHRVSGAYPSVSTFTFIATLLAELLGYNAIVFSNERSADIGNTTHLGLPVNHQWCKSSEAEALVNTYIQQFITPSIQTYSLLRPFSELEIVRQFVQYKKYLHHVTSCNSYFWLSRPEQYLARTPYWCRECPKCVFLFACFAAFLPKQEVVKIFGGNIFTRKNKLSFIKRTLGIEGFKPLDCVGEPEEMILAMHYAARTGDYDTDTAICMFREHFPETYDFAPLEKSVFAVTPAK